MKLHLADANRYRDQLKNAAGLRGKKGQANITAVVDVMKFMAYEDVGELEEALKRARTEASTRNQLLLQYERDYFTLRHAIITANRGAGIEDLLLKMEELNREKARAEAHLDQLNADQVYELEQLLQVRGRFRSADTSGYRTPQVQLAVIERHVLETKVRALTRELERLKRELNHLNATTTVDVELSKEACEKLGL